MLSQNSRMKECMKIMILPVIVLGLTFALSCSDCRYPTDSDTAIVETKAPGAGPAGGAVTKKWTFIFYIAAGEPFTYTPLEDFAAQFASGDNIDAVCLEDVYGEPTRIWYIDGNHTPVLREELGAVNMGSEATLRDFLDYAKSNHPSDRYIVSFYGHGGGWGGACTDADPEYGVLRMENIRNALAESGGVDLVLFSAPCWMGAFESAYELRECTEVYIGSENLSHYGFWTTVMGSLSDELSSNPDISNPDLGRRIIAWMRDSKKYYAGRGSRELTMAAVMTARLDALGAALDDLSVAYLDDPAGFRALVDDSRKKIVDFEEASITDLNSVMLGLKSVENDPEIMGKIDNVIWCLSDALLDEIHHPRFHGINGLSIFLPDDESAWMITYYTSPVFGLDFAVNSRWDELLAAAFSGVAGARDIQQGFNAERSLEYPFPQIDHR